MTTDQSLPAPGLAAVRIAAASPDVARQVAQALRAWFASTEQRSYPAGTTGTGTRLHLSVDTTHTRTARFFPAGHQQRGRPPKDTTGGTVRGQAMA